MSHITTVSVRIRNLEAMKAALKEFGAEFRQNQTTYKWYGTFVGDSPMPKGMTKEMLGKCAHAVHVPGVNYEIGLVKQADNSYTMAYDFYDYRPQGHDGGRLKEVFGDGLKKLLQSYAVNCATIQAKAKGWLTERVKLPNGSIRLTLTGMA